MKGELFLVEAIAKCFNLLEEKKEIEGENRTVKFYSSAVNVDQQKAVLWDYDICRKHTQRLHLPQ